MRASRCCHESFFTFRDVAVRCDIYIIALHQYLIAEGFPIAFARTLEASCGLRHLLVGAGRA
jgi:hypothetical protein